MVQSSDGNGRTVVDDGLSQHEKFIGAIYCAELEGLFAALHDRGDHFRLADRASVREFAIYTFLEVQMANKLGGTVHNDTKSRSHDHKQRSIGPEPLGKCNEMRDVSGSKAMP